MRTRSGVKGGRHGRITKVMRVDLNSGLLDEVPYEPSPNCDIRPMETEMDLIVIHGISLPPGEFGGYWIDDLFNNRLDPKAHPYFEGICQLQVSSHLLIRREGQLMQFVPFHKRAWHAGESRYEGREACNDFSIGIELEGCDDIPYAPIQYHVLTDVVHALLRAYPYLTPKRIAGHNDIAPWRKTDPGPAFDWARFHELLEQKLES